ncbi:hypothetical protein C2E23DRAFT_814278 [Lenzites betulinus]|nr:hypothetical protein C2E23DRAFT_814278 [Lenzites betulinus]
MDITDNDSLPPASPDGRYWLPKTTRVQDDSVEERVLRPNWDRSWGDNKAGWVLDVIHIIRRDVREYTHTKIEELTQKELSDGLEGVWGGLQKRWALQNKTQQIKDEKAASREPTEVKHSVGDGTDRGCPGAPRITTCVHLPVAIHLH